MAKVRLKKGSERFPQAQIGDEVEISDDRLLEQLERDGTVERSAMSGAADLKAGQAAEYDRVNQQKQQREHAGAMHTGQDNPTNRTSGSER